MVLRSARASRTRGAPLLFVLVYVVAFDNATSNHGNLVVCGYPVILRGWSSLQVSFLCVFRLNYVICACALPSFDQGQVDSATDERVLHLSWLFCPNFLGGAILLGQEMLYRSNQAEKNKHQVTFVPSVRALLRNLSVRLILFIYS